jgi:E3 ubiquitin-protein ligase RNF14
VNSIPSNMNGSRYHRNKSQQQHRTKSKLRYVNKSELIVSSPNSAAVEEPVSPEVVDVNSNNNKKNNTVDDVASSSKTKEEDDYDNNDIDFGTNRLDKLLCDIQQIELSQEEITINDQLQQDEVIINLIGLLLNTFLLMLLVVLTCFATSINRISAYV